MLDALKAEPEECIMVEDALPGIRGAKSAGIDSVVIEERHNADDRVQLEAAALARFASPAALLKGIQAEIEAAAGGIHCMRSSR